MAGVARAAAAGAVLALALTACSGGADDTGGSDEPVAAPTPDAVDVTTPGAPSGPTDDSDVTGATAPGGATTEDPTTEDAPAAAPDGLDVEVVLDGLALPWDVQLLPDGTALVTERAGRLLAVDDPPGSAGAREVSIDLSELFVGSEAGLMGLAVSPQFEQDRTIFLCHAAQPTGGRPDVRVTRWTLDADVTAATQDAVVVDGIPLTSGRHSGCRLLVLPDGTLLVGTGDAADERNPQALDSLGGKVLAVTPDGDPADADGHVEGADPRILTYGHRNVQGLALQPGTDPARVWSVEHGPDVDDEVNVLVPGGNYGWDPGPGYDESVPMTDTGAFPDAVGAAWSSGAPTHATSGAVFLEGEQWGAWDGALAVAELKGSGVTIFDVDGQEVLGTVRPPELDGTYGRLRSLTLDDDGALWVTSSDGQGDVLLRVTPGG
ncbi:PQQ-dependent sugar dehydrogenase [Ornithinimicrobium pekingense]|uniref:Glucose dehydrogenase n=1 Tax=Ornithinimicrobium pekingense TaxID=384677 RepID=A0ABQ2F665_9MICO|nr:PQQ-dependent sugar dehydrogenase [Ornithinimicrobium pekingense]GGK56956.1 glucose dehydrogenase [Ornithinimicrobium pekingense]